MNISNIKVAKEKLKEMFAGKVWYKGCGINSDGIVLKIGKSFYVNGYTIPNQIDGVNITVELLGEVIPL